VRTTTNRTLILILAALALVASACAGDNDKVDTNAGDGGGDAPTLSIKSPKQDAHIDGNVVNLALDVSGIDIVKADGDTSGDSGHFHVFIDTEPVAAGEAVPVGDPKIVHSADNPVVIPGLSIGDHTFTVVLGDGAHNRIGDASDSVAVHVDGPELDATAPATIAAGEPLNIDVAVSGLTLVKADGDTSGKTGHLHVFVDVPPVAPGVAVPVGDPKIIHSATSPVTVTGLEPGDHTIWVVFGDGAHIALTKPVRDKVVVKVT
jgi:hypothetical protein